MALKPEVVLDSFQQEMVDKAKRVPNFGCFDEMGTGKTVMAIALDDIRRKQPWERPKTLVVTMAGAMGDTWGEHFNWMTTLRWVRCDPKNRALSWSRFVNTDADVFIVHWEVLRLMPELKTVQWLHVIGDECQRIMHRTNQMSKHLKKIRCAFKTGLSGTPTSGRPDLMWSILNWLYPDKWRSYWKFFKEYVKTETDVYGYQKVVGPQNEEEFLKLIEPYTIRRLLRDVKTMPPVLPPQTFYVDLYPEQRQAYEQMKKHMVAWVKEHETAGDDVEPIIAQATVSQLVRLLQFSAAYARVDEDNRVWLTEPSSKLDLCMDLIHQITGEGNKVVVFAQSRQLIELLNARLRAKNEPFVTIHGNVPQLERGPAKDAFQQDPRIKVFTGTIRSGGTGITLTAAHHLIFLQREWSPSDNKQAISRLDRYGQEHPVHVIDIVARDTKELEKNEKVELKWSWVRKMLGDV